MMDFRPNGVRLEAKQELGSASRMSQVPSGTDARDVGSLMVSRPGHQVIPALWYHEGVLLVLDTSPHPGYEPED